MWAVIQHQINVIIALRYLRRYLKNTTVKKTIINYLKRLVPEAESNHRHADFQSGGNSADSDGCGKFICQTKVENQALSGALSNLPAGDNVEQAAHWYARNNANRKRAFIPLLRDRFGLTPMEAIMAAQLAREIEAGEVR